MKHLWIAIDGPSGVGKSTTAKGLAKRLGIAYLDTGALFRTIAIYLMDKMVPLKDADKVSDSLSDLTMDVKFIDGDQHMILCGNDVTGRLRAQDISQAASIISQYPRVRSKVLKIEKKVAERQSVIMDGRDIGTKVLPDAQLKIFLTADTRERALRRYRELNSSGVPDVRTIEKLEVWLRERDLRDSSRNEAPLRQADDAVRIDSTYLSIKEVEDMIMELLSEKL